MRFVYIAPVVAMAFALCALSFSRPVLASGRAAARPFSVSGKPSLCPRAARIGRKNAFAVSHTAGLPFLGRSSSIPVRAKGEGLGGVVESFMDISKFVSSEGAKGTQYPELADAIGDDVYLDLNGWHLYWKDVKVAENVKLSEFVAQNIGPRVKTIKPDDLEVLLSSIPINLGGGKVQLALISATPDRCLKRLIDIIRDAADDW
mmetsp:Transcript_15618/g.31650  ORF Transcript_15618/g.31650 Transcript_15618/m.31650 type:complete len:204 (-) Transcript_15618:95-706(-)